MSNIFFDNHQPSSFKSTEVTSKALQPIFTLIPDELKALPRWVTSLKKVPYCSGSINGKASTISPETWSCFDLTQTAYEEGGRDGIGFVFNGDGIVGIDLDHCVVDGQPNDGAIEILKLAGCGYIEYSQSGNGLHAYGFHHGLKFKKRIGLYKGVKTEIYNSSSFFVVTGHVFQAGGLTELTDLQSIIDGLTSSSMSRSAVTEETEVTEVTEAIAYDSYASSASSASSVSFPKSCMPTGTGMRHECIFNLARHLKHEYPHIDKHQLRPIFTIWWDKVLPLISTKDFDESWTAFLLALDNVKHPLGNSLTKISAGLPDNSIKNAASIYGNMGANMLELCIRFDENQRINWNSDPFPLSCRLAGSVLGINRSYANNLLSLMTKHGFLELVTKANTVKANKYRLNPKFRKTL